MNFCEAILKLEVTGHVSDEVRLRRTALVSFFVEPPKFKMPCTMKSVPKLLADEFGIENVTVAQLNIDVSGLRTGYRFVSSTEDREKIRSSFGSINPSLWLARLLEKHGISTAQDLERFESNPAPQTIRTLGLRNSDWDGRGRIERVERKHEQTRPWKKNTLKVLKKSVKQVEDLPTTEELLTSLQGLSAFQSFLDAGKMVANLCAIMEKMERRMHAYAAGGKNRSTSPDAEILEGLVIDLQEKCERLEKQKDAYQRRLKMLRTGVLLAEDWETFEMALPTRSIWHESMGEQVDIKYSSEFKVSAMKLLSPKQRLELQESLVTLALEGFAHTKLCSAQVEYGANGFKGSYWASVACGDYSFLWAREKKTLHVVDLQPATVLKPRLQEESGNNRLLGLQRLIADVRGDK